MQNFKFYVVKYFFIFENYIYFTVIQKYKRKIVCMYRFLLNSWLLLYINYNIIKFNVKNYDMINLYYLIKFGTNNF